MKSKKNLLSSDADLEIDLTARDIEAMKRKNALMTINQYLEFLKTVNSISASLIPRKGPEGEKFELP